MRERAWPMAGLLSAGPVGNGSSLIQLASIPGGPPNYASFWKIYKSNPWIFAAVTAISFGLSRNLLLVHQMDANGDHEPVLAYTPNLIGRPPAPVALARLLQMPEPGVSRHEWVKKVMVDRLVYGNALIWMERPGSGLPQWLWHVPWRKVKIHRGSLVPIISYEIMGDKGSRFLDPADVIHIGRNGDPDPFCGPSPIEPLQYTVALHDSLQRHLAAYFKNAARPSGILKTQPGTSKEAQQLIQEQVRRLYAAPEQAGKIMVTSAEWQELGKDPANSHIVELAKLSREEISAAFSVPPPVLGILDRAIKSNVVQLRSQYIRDVIGPHADAFEQDLMAQLVWTNPQWDGMFLRFDLDNALRPDLEARAQVYEHMRHVWTPNEMRQMEGRKPLSGEAGEYADTVWMPSGEVPLGMPLPQAPGMPGDPAGEADPAGGAEPDLDDPKPEGADPDPNVMGV